MVEVELLRARSDEYIHSFISSSKGVPGDFNDDSMKGIYFDPFVLNKDHFEGIKILDTDNPSDIKDKNTNTHTLKLKNDVKSNSKEQQ